MVEGKYFGEQWEPTNPVKIVPVDNMNVYYAVEFAIIAVYTYLVVVFVPLVSNLLFGRTFESAPEEAPRGPRTSRKKKRK